MPCGKSESSLPQSEMYTFLNAVQDQSLTAEEISIETKLPLFKVRSKLRELVLLEYLEIKGDQYVLSNRGKSLLGS
jgi:predicted transcriptional regulator